MRTTFSISGVAHGSIDPPQETDTDFRFEVGDIVRLETKVRSTVMLRVSSVVIEIHDRNAELTQEVSLEAQ